MCHCPTRPWPHAPPRVALVSLLLLLGGTMAEAEGVSPPPRWQRLWRLLTRRAVGVPMATAMVLVMVAMPPQQGAAAGPTLPEQQRWCSRHPPPLPQDPLDPDGHCRRWDLSWPLLPHKCSLLCTFYAKFDIVLRPRVCFQSPRGSCTLMLTSRFKMCTTH